MKKEVKMYEYGLYIDEQYTVEQLNELFKDAKEYYASYEDSDLVSHYKIGATNEWDYHDNYAKITMTIYRMETDKEYEDRLEEENKRKEEEEKARVASQIRKDLEKAKKEALLADPEYQTFLKLKGKFSK